jgi:3D (Asp-Asp-Asp) domain-containing protein
MISSIDESKETVTDSVNEQSTYIIPTIEILTPTPEPKTTPMEFIITAYDLSIKSCGKSMRHKEYGITARGDCIRGKTRKQAMAIAVDPKIIPLGSVIKIEFQDTEYQKYDGMYIAIDTGSEVKERIIDLFLGDFQSNKESKIVSEFGSTKAWVTIINKGD